MIPIHTYLYIYYTFTHAPGSISLLLLLFPFSFAVFHLLGVRMDLLACGGKAYVITHILQAFKQLYFFSWISSTRDGELYTTGIVLQFILYVGHIL